MPSLTPTHQFKCSCGMYSSKMFKLPTETDYLFFLNKHKDDVAWTIKQGHTAESCLEAK